jgi:hypothetical protein
MATRSPFTVIPGVGPSIAADLEKLGYTNVTDLKGEDPEVMYTHLMSLEGKHIDRCVLYVFRCAVYFAGSPKPSPDKLLWWNWKR